VIALQPIPESSGGAIPAHVAVIMDGNGRWATARKLPRKLGHKQGAESLRRLLEACENHPQITHLTVYAFSSENWKRPSDEVSDLMELLAFYLERESRKLHERGVRLRFIGDRNRLSETIQNMLKETEALTENNRRFTLVVALSYGSRQELCRAAQRVCEAVVRGELRADAIDESTFADALDTHGIPDPDLLIRTGGDQRLSNFLLWQSAYTELYFTDVLWPDFAQADFDTALQCYAQRERRFGTRL
jgi:undecaprenyl diphosphate synthase